MDQGQLTLSQRTRVLVRRIKAVLRAIRYAGNGRFCPVCGRSTRCFRSYGLQRRDDAECVICKALERHRFVWLFMQRHTNLFDGQSKKFLHVAPERCFAAKMSELLADDYLTADLDSPLAMVQMDITDIQYPDSTFDAIYCSNVLEHVPDDRRAIREFCRVLKPDGWAILLVPIWADKTFEDPAITDPQERTRVYGQANHVRLCGPDYVDRIREEGFNVRTIEVSDIATPEEATRMGLTPASGVIYYCTKPLLES